MLKNKCKMLILLFTLLALLTTVSFATEPITSDEPVVEDATISDVTSSEENTTSEIATEDQEIYSDDLYLFDETVVMDKLVDGNVYIMGNNVSVTGQINGNLFVLAQDFTLDNAYVRNSIFLCANTATFNGACTDLYAACNSLKVSYDSYIARDSRIVCDSLNFKGLNTRNMFISAPTIDFGSDSELATIYGNLNYSSTQELDLGEEIVAGEIIYTPQEITDAKDSTDVVSICMKIVTTLVFSVVIYFLIHVFTPKFEEGTYEYASVKVVYAFLIGLAALIVIPIICLILLFTDVLAKVALAICAVYGLLLAISFTVFRLYITKVIGKKVTQIPEFCLFIIVTLVLSILEVLPFISGVVTFIMLITGFGILVMSLAKVAFPAKKEEKIEEPVVKEIKEKTTTKKVEEEKPKKTTTTKKKETTTDAKGSKKKETTKKKTTKKAEKEDK